MKHLFFVFVTLMITLHVQAQTKFVRLIDKHNHKIAKGHITGVTDSTVLIYRSGKEFHVPIEQVNFILQGRSAGFNILIGALVGGATGMIVGASTNNDEMGAVVISETVGLICGAVAGTLIGVFTKAVNPVEYTHVNGKHALIEQYIRENQ